MVASLSKELDNKTTEDDLLDLISERELQYAKMSSLLGKNQDDQQSAFSAASRTIIEAVGRPKHAFLAQVMRTELLRALTEMDLVTRAKRIEVNL